ncbi:MAG: DUF2163 domain-containing protein [Xanthobacteraceae bacterium]|nr:DUF2163 domain-containing protein [Xanthobacteraceae bacterium]MBX3535563.1 DUF2163 domain-containing protein [Xanthobacteraceae bacterium]MBX3550184.1 DUF2163 domain-containing protein [Xanthobacteraceae bacterium]MCW5678043.1 DUF2163 domain-containing protein [Xanthobacteraceae bacterium]
MRIIPDGLAAHLASGATTLCNCWRISRRDGVVQGFTDHDENISFEGTLFRAGTGFEGTEVESRFGLAATGSELHGALSDESISENDLVAGKYDAARVELFLVDWSNAENRMLQRSGDVGEIRREGAAFAVEIRGLAQELDQERGRIFASSCDADFGDARCGIDLDAPEFRSGGAVASIEGAALVRVTGLEEYEDDWFTRGKLIWNSGANEGVAVEIKTHRAEEGVVSLALWQTPPNPVANGDAFVVTAGCDKRFETCRAKFANTLNFRGFPHLPGNDFVVSYAVPGEPGNDGTPVR